MRGMGDQEEDEERKEDSRWGSGTANGDSCGGAGRGGGGGGGGEEGGDGRGGVAGGGGGKGQAGGDGGRGDGDGGGEGGASRRRRPLSLLERLRLSQNAWSPGAPWDREGVHAALWGRPAGSFLVLRDSASWPVLLCVSSGGESAAATDYPIKHTGTVYQLSQSCLGFSDLSQLVAFYSLSRDVLSTCLSIPLWFYSLTEQPESHLSLLGPKSWLCPTPDLQPGHMTQRDPDTFMCSIQVTSANGALFLINPLYLHEHGDDWLTNKPTSSQFTARTANQRRERRLSTSRPWGGAGLLTKRAISLDQECSGTRPISPGPTNTQCFESTQPSRPPSPPAGRVVLRRPSQDSVRRTSYQGPEARPPSGPEARPLSSPVLQSPHRVSWIEGGVWLTSELHPPSMEPDSLSISSVEEEADGVSSPAPYHPSTHRLANKVKHRLSAVSQALGGLVCQQKRLANRVQELSERRGGVFSEAVRGFVEQTQRGMILPGVTGVELLQEVRMSLTALRETLLDCPEINTLLDTMTDTPDSDIDSMLEMSLHKVALKPVSSHLYSCLQTSRSLDGSLKRLRDNQRVLEGRGVEELDGAAGAGVPDPPTLERIQQRWAAMHQVYSPSKKVQIVLKVCKSIYHSMSSHASPGVVYGADDFLPCLTWVVLRSDVVTLQLDTDYMMELLDPTQLQGEGGYYLTTLYASLFYISSFRPRLACRQLSAEAQHSLSQWHRRRTLHCNQSRRSGNRKTIRRVGNAERGRAKTGEKGSEEERGGGAAAPPVGEAESLQVVFEGVAALSEEGHQVEGDQSTSRALSPQGPPEEGRGTLLVEGDRQPVERQKDCQRDGAEGRSQRTTDDVQTMTAGSGGGQVSQHQTRYEAMSGKRPDTHMHTETHNHTLTQRQTHARSQRQVKRMSREVQ